MQPPKLEKPQQLEKTLSVPIRFRFGEVSSLTKVKAPAPSDPSLGPLSNFTGTFAGNGFNTIFRPDSGATPTPLPVPVLGSDNVLELNLTQETLSFSKAPGSVPNRGTGAQADAFLHGVPYLQPISDVTIPRQPTGIHFEPGLWVIVPSTTDPPEGQTLVRMASIPDRKSTRLNSSHQIISYAVFCLKKKNRFKSLDTLKVKIIRVTFRRVIRTIHKKSFFF